MTFYLLDRLNLRHKNFIINWGKSGIQYLLLTSLSSNHIPLVEKAFILLPGVLTTGDREALK